MNHMMHNIAHFQTKTFMKRNKIIFLIYLTLSLGLQGASAESDWETCSRLQVTEGRKEEAVVEESQVASEKNFKLVSARILQMGGKALLK